MARRKLPVSGELKTAMDLSKIVSDVRLDLDLVGTYLAEVAPAVSYRRLTEIVEAANYEKEQQNDRQHINSIL
jgi:uncharacterized protein YqiB (DUF1249 family)